MIASPANTTLLFASHDFGAIFLRPSDSKDLLKDIVEHFTIFVLHPSVPYAKLFETTQHYQVHAGLVWDVKSYFHDLQQLYAPDYPGPFTIGVWWQEANKKDTSAAH